MTVCCVCLEDIKAYKKYTSYKCNICVNTSVCKKCFKFMFDSNIHTKCPVCRSDNWCNNDSVLIIINDNMEINDNHCDITIKVRNGIMKLKMILNILVKIVIYLLLIWSCGFILMSIYNNSSYQYIHYPDQIIITMFLGTIFIFTLFKCKNLCMNNNEVNNIY